MLKSVRNNQSLDSLPLSVTRRRAFAPGRKEPVGAGAASRWEEDSTNVCFADAAAVNAVLSNGMKRGEDEP